MVVRASGRGLIVLRASAGGLIGGHGGLNSGRTLLGPDLGLQREALTLAIQTFISVFFSVGISGSST